MPILAALPADPTTVLLACGATAVLLFAVAGGFWAGVLCAPWLQEWAIRRASSQIHKMYDLVMVELQRAQRLCAELAAVSGTTLSKEEWHRMDKVQNDFRETFSRISKACGIEPIIADANKAANHPKDFQIDWIKTPVDPASGLPNLTAFEQNLAAMLSQGMETQLESGLLFIRMDKAESLRKRLGNDAIEILLGRLSSLVIRASRDQDVLCRLNDDLLALLCPSLPPLSGTKMAEKIREAVRSAHFRVEETGPEVLVTASFGYANCSPGDAEDIVRDRARDAMTRSGELGRNQLHVHDGQSRALCRT